jgi:hypothetical protein
MKPATKMFVSTHSFSDAKDNAVLHGYLPKGMQRGQYGEFIVYGERFVI